MESREIGRVFYRDGYRLAARHLEEGITAQRLISAIRQLFDSMDELLASFIRRSALEGRTAACKQGCAWCCHQEVFAVTHELLFLRDYVMMHLKEETRKAFLERAREKSQQIQGLPLEEKLQVRSPCPFLESGSCQVYDARPMSCRIYLSSSVEACKADHDRPGDQHRFPELYEFPLQAGRMMNEGFVAYLKQSGLTVAEWSLEEGFAAMMTAGQSMEGWIDSRSASL